MNRELAAYINEWLMKARNDLLSAQRLIEIEPVILDTACFHCQQAVEKSLKAFLIFKGIPIEKTHNLNFLIGECAIIDPDFCNMDLMEMNSYAVKIRYPDDYFLPEINEVRDIYQQAILINELVKSKVEINLGK